MGVLDRRVAGRAGRSARRERRWGERRPARRAQPPSKALLVALVLACASLITLDYHGGADSPIEPARRAVGEVFGPIETGATTALRPFIAVPDWFRTHDSMRDEIGELEAENARLRAAGRDVRLRPQPPRGVRRPDRGRRRRSATPWCPARVVGLGPSQSFSRTVTIDAGSQSGIHPDMTVLNNDGLVGRVLRVTSTTATVLLIVDADSVVGGRVGESMEVGFLHGRGVLGNDGRLDLELVDKSAVPMKHDTVVTWGSQGGAPYVSGVPVGRVTSVYSSLRETSQRAVIEPFVDFGSLDLVGVVVPSGSKSDRSVIEADGRPAMNGIRLGRRHGPVVSVALVLQVSLFPHLAWQGVVPNLCLLVVVGAALTRGAQFAAVLGFLPASSSTSRRPPTTSPAAGRWRSSSSGTSPAGCARTSSRPPWPWSAPSPRRRSSAPRSSP